MKWVAPSYSIASLTCCLRLFGGYGYMNEYPIARLYADTRVTRIHGGPSEVLEAIISKSLGIWRTAEHDSPVHRLGAGHPGSTTTRRRPEAEPG